MRKRYGLPQVVALLLLAVFVAQAAYLAVRAPLTVMELQFAFAGLSSQQPGWSIQGNSGADAQAQLSPLVAHMAGALFRSGTHQWLARVPFILFGALLGASLWYVARRLYGNAGGYVALLLYVFSPSMISYAARIQPEIAAAWGTFGCIFTGIAVAHTLYAPREVVLWNWRRILLLGVAIGLGMSAQPAVVLALPIALAFMLYLVPERRAAALAIIGSTTAVGLLVMTAMYGFRLSPLANAATMLLDPTLRVLDSRIGWYLVARFFWQNGPGLVLLLAVGLLTYAAWRRTRFFGNTAPLVTALLLIVIGLLLPHAAGLSFLVLALPFVFVFVAGVTADLLQTPFRPVVLGVVMAALATHAYFSLAGLWRV
jgi:4-amino-4-deoxy-L-arabinose transferase-like glycosyltransferase